MRHVDPRSKPEPIIRVTDVSYTILQLISFRVKKTKSWVGFLELGMERGGRSVCLRQLRILDPPAVSFGSQQN